MQSLKKRNIFAAGISWLNRFGSTVLASDSIMKKSGRGSTDQVVSKDGDVVLKKKWRDDRSVVLVSNFISTGNKDKVDGWDKDSKA